MSSSPENFEQTLHRLGAEASRSLTIHPEYRELAGYCEDTLPARAEEAIGEHLSHCPACARVVLDLLQPPAPVEVSASERDRQWHALLERAEEEMEPAKPIHTEPKARSSDSHLEDKERLSASDGYDGASRWLLIAAAVAFAALGGWWLLGGSSTPTETADEPRVLADLTDIPKIERAKTGTRGSGQSEIFLHYGDPPSAWELKTANESPYDRYTIRILSPAKTLWEAPIEPLAETLEFFGLQLTPDFFSIGDYQIVVTGWRGASEQELGVFSLSIRE